MNNKLILVVEDEKPLSEAIVFKLKKSNFEVVAVKTVEQAKKYVSETGHIDAIWLDHYLIGKEDGLDFVGWCKSEESQYKNIPIFVVSNTASPDKVATYLSLGVNNYYVKSNYRLDQIIEEISAKIDCTK